MSGGGAGFDEPVGLAGLEGRCDELRFAVGDGDRGAGQGLVVVDGEGGTLERVGAVLVGRADGLGAGLFDADGARAGGRAGLVVGGTVVVVGAGDGVVEASLGGEAPARGEALEGSLTVPTSGLIAGDGHADEPGRRRPGFDGGALGEDVGGGAVLRACAAQAIERGGDRGGAQGEAGREGRGVDEATGRARDRAVIRGGHAVSDGDRVARGALNTLHGLVDAQLGGLLLDREVAGDRHGGGGLGRGHIGEVDAAGHGVARDVDGLADAIHARNVGELPASRVRVVGDLPRAEVAGFTEAQGAASGDAWASLGDDELGVAGDEGLVSRGHGAVLAVARGGQGAVLEGGPVDETRGILIGGEGFARGRYEVADAQRREVEGGDCAADRLGLRGDSLRDANVALLAEGGVQAPVGALVFLRAEGGDGGDAFGRHRRAGAVSAGREAGEDEAVRDTVDHDGLVRGSPRDRQHVVGARALVGGARGVGVGGRVVRVDVAVASALADVAVAVPDARAGIAVEGGVGRVRGARGRPAGTRGEHVGAVVTQGGGGVGVVLGFLLVEGEGILDAANGDVDRGMHPRVGRQHLEVVVPHGAQQEGLADGDVAGVVRLVSQGVGVLRRDDAGTHRVGGGQAARDVGPVVPRGDARVQHRLGCPGLEGGRGLGGVCGIIGARAAHGSHVGVIGNVRRAVCGRAVDDGRAEAPTR